MGSFGDGWEEVSDGLYGYNQKLGNDDSSVIFDSVKVLDDAYETVEIKVTAYAIVSAGIQDGTKLETICNLRNQ